MKISGKSYLWLFLLLYASTYTYGQMGKYDYKRELTGISGQWHKVVLPNDMFGKVAQNLADIRIFGITANDDTVEAPYLLRINTEKISNKEISFKTLNASHNDKGYYFTFEGAATEPINQIKLEFKQQNFDWRLKLEGSQNQQEWFTVTENYRILGIKNGLTDFQFTKLTFPLSSYRFFRLLIDSKARPDLISARMSQCDTTEGIFRNYPIKQISSQENKQLKQTEIDIDLQLPVSVSHIKIGISNTFDYYRPVTIRYLTDSIQTEQGWKYTYRTLTSGTLNSLEENAFTFSSTTLQKLKILIHNQDNQPLRVDSIHVKGYVHNLVARFTEPATYFLTYGNQGAVKASYDIDLFADKIPKTMTALQIGKELTIEKEEIPVKSPLFKNKNWLWAIMAAIIVLLGWFSVTMMRKK